MPVHPDVAGSPAPLDRGDRQREATAWAALPMALAFAAGVWLLLAPTVLSYADAGVDAASWNDRIVGPALAVLAVVQIVTPVAVTALGLAVAILGAWLVVAPFLLGYDGAPRAVVNDVLVGAGVVVLAALAAVRRR